MDHNLIIILVVVLSLAVILLIMYFAYNNQEIALRKEAEAQEKAITSVHDTMWKVIKEKASVSEKYRETFEKIYPELINGRYKDNDVAMKWIQEANPDFDTSLYTELMQTIEAQRMYFQTAQERMLDIIREREILIDSFPQKWFISNRQPIHYTVIASDQSNHVIKSRVDNDTLIL